jgi:hypothetical protein
LLHMRLWQIATITTAAIRQPENATNVILLIAILFLVGAGKSMRAVVTDLVFMPRWPLTKS